MAVPEARIEETDEGAVVASPGWFVINMADCAWTRDDKGGEWSTYGEPEGEFQQYGIGIHVLHPGQVNGPTTRRACRRTSSSSPESACC